MPTPNTFPAPIGPTVSFTNLREGTTTANFSWGEGGLYTISVELADLSFPGDSVSLQNVVAGVSTAVLTIQRSGYYDFIVPFGGGTYNFTTVNAIKNIRMTQRTDSLGQPSGTGFVQ